MINPKRIYSTIWVFRCLICGKKYPYPIGIRAAKVYPKCCGKTCVAHAEKAI